MLCPYRQVHSKLRVRQQTTGTIMVAKREKKLCEILSIKYRIFCFVITLRCPDYFDRNCSKACKALSDSSPEERDFYSLFHKINTVGHL